MQKRLLQVESILQPAKFAYAHCIYKADLSTKSIIILDFLALGSIFWINLGKNI